MTDNGKEEIKNETIELKITVSKEGGINVSGPIQDGIFCFGLLEKAKTLIEMHNMRKSVESQRIIQPKHGILDFARRKS